MATASDKTYCVTCRKDKIAYKCEGCSQNFCFNHLVEHRQQLDKQFDELENQRNLFRQTISEQTTNPHNDSLLQQINQWERDSINKIQATANETREFLLKHTHEHIQKIETKLIKLTEEIKGIREENDFNENNLKKLKEKLKELEEEFNKLSNIHIQQNASSFIHQISVIINSDQFKPKQEKYANKKDSSSSINTTSITVPLTELGPRTINISNIPINAKWVQNGTTVAGGNGQGTELNKFRTPFGICVADDQTIYVADFKNHSVTQWKSGATTGQIVAGGNGSGYRNDQLHYPWDVLIDRENDALIISDYNTGRVVRWPRRNGTSGGTIISNISCRGLAMDNNGYLYVSDDNKHEVRRWKIGETEGTLVAGGNGHGSRLDQLYNPYYIFVDEDQSVYVSDRDNHRVMKWMKGAKEGIVVAGGQSRGNKLTQLSLPMGILVDQLGTVYVADTNNSRVMRWLKGAREGSVVVGGNGKGKQANQFSWPAGLSFDTENNLYVIDHDNYRVQKFLIDSSN